MTNQDIKQIYEGIQELIFKTEIKLKPKIAFILIKNKNLLEPLYLAINESIKQTWQRYGTSENGQIKVDNDKIPSLEYDIKELLEVENNIQIEQINIDDLEDNNISLELMWKLNKIIKET